MSIRKVLELAGKAKWEVIRVNGKPELLTRNLAIRLLMQK
jgi:hypothetical protein